MLQEKVTLMEARNPCACKENSRNFRVDMYSSVEHELRKVETLSYLAIKAATGYSNDRVKYMVHEPIVTSLPSSIHSYSSHHG
jgi:hypothetical protein